MNQRLKVALVHDQLNQAGGAERVLYALTKLFPTAPIYTMIYDAKRLKGFEHSKVKTTFIQDMPGGVSHLRWYLPLMPAAVEHLDLSGYDLVISSSSALMKGVITAPHAIHLCYCHTPTRYLWSDTTEYSKAVSAPFLVKKILPLYLHKLRTWDQVASQRVDYYIANSNFVATRIKKYYGRNSTVIYPPIDTSNFYTTEEVGDYYFMIGRLRPYKKFDLAIKAFNKLGIPLKIAGTGDQMDYLKSIAKPNIEFLGQVSEEKKRELLSKCIAFINPQVEDFGIVSVEAMASGRPVIAYKAGGALEQIVDGVTGTFFEDQTWESIVDCILHFNHEQYKSPVIKEHAEQFSVERFNQKFSEAVSQLGYDSALQDAQRQN